MSTIRREGLDFSAEFTMMPNRWLRDGRLSLKAAALLMLLLSHRAGWRTSIRQLVAERREGRESIMAGIAELEEFGYLRREQLRDEKGQMAESVWTILDPDDAPPPPMSENPTTAKSAPWSGFPTSAEPESDRSRTKKNKYKNTNPREDQAQQPRPRGKATEAQVEFLMDLHERGGGQRTPEILAHFQDMSISRADQEIRSATREDPGRRAHF